MGGQGLLAHLSRQEADIASALQTELQVMSNVVTVDTLSKSLRPHKSLSVIPQYSVLIERVKETCSLQRMVTDFHSVTAQLGMMIGDLSSAILSEVTNAYAYTPAHVPSNTSEYLAALLPQLPQWCDREGFALSFRALDDFSQRTLNAQPVDLRYLQGTLETLRNVNDTCNKLLTSTPAMPTNTWDSAANFGTAWSFGPAMLFSPPPTPEHSGSPVLGRKRHNSPLANATRAARAAFDVAADAAHGPNVPNQFSGAFLDDDFPERLANMADHQVPSQYFKERPPGFRVVMCRHMDAKGKCKKAGTCTFAHSQNDLEKFRALYIPTERCNFGLKCGKTTCKYSHSPAEQHRAIRIYLHHCNLALKTGAM